MSTTTDVFASWEGAVLREARTDDLSRLLEIEEESQPSPWSAAVFEKEFELVHSHVWVVEADRVDAFIVFWLVHDEVHILNVAVTRSARRRGLAKRMVERVVKFAESAECVAITLEVRVGNQPAIALYDSFDFRVIGHRPRYYRDNGEDAAVMARILEEEDVEEG